VTPAVLRGAAAAFAVLVVAVVALAVVAAGQRSELDDARTEIRALQRSDADSRRALRRIRSRAADARKQAAGLAAALQAVEQRLKKDEAVLHVTQRQLPPDVTKLASTVAPSVVIVSCGGLGSGFALDLEPRPGYATVVVTAAHVVDGCGDGAGLDVTQGGTPLRATVRTADRQVDVALIDVREELPVLEPADAPVVGEFVMAVGTPLFEDFEGTVTEGTISRVEAGAFLHTAPTSNGNSGGPLVDRAGGVVGIVQGSFTANEDAPVVENLNVAVRLKALCARLLAGAECGALP
jgi:S1-C subfamily serine protease